MNILSLPYLPPYHSGVVKLGRECVAEVLFLGIAVLPLQSTGLRSGWPPPDAVLDLLLRQSRRNSGLEVIRRGSVTPSSSNIFPGFPAKYLLCG